MARSKGEGSIYYIEKSKEVVGIYLDFVAASDLHIYSVDECFLDVTDYLKLYKKTPYGIIYKTLKKSKTLIKEFYFIRIYLVQNA